MKVRIGPHVHRRLINAAMRRTLELRGKHFSLRRDHR
jgi:hypothetical protein